MTWSLAATLSQVGLGVVVLAVLARHLSPHAFGIVGAALSVNALAALIADLGIAPALIQRPDLTKAHVACALLVSLVVGMALALAIALAAPLAAAYFGLPELTSVLPALGITFVLSAYAAVQTNLMRRELRFRGLAMVQICSQLFAYAPVSIALALLGWKEWALVLGLIAQAAAAALLLSWLMPRCPMPRLHRRELRELLGFGTGYSLARVANHVASQGDAWIVGGWLGSAALGVYQRALQLLYAPVNLIGSAIDKVAYPVLAGMQDDRARSQRSFLHATSVVSAIGVPTSAVLFVLAPDLVRAVLGPGWEQCVLPLQVLSLGLPFRVSYKIGHSLARAHGAVHATAWRQAVFAALVLAGSFLCRGHGIAGVAVAVVAATCVNHLLTLDLSLRLLQLSWRSVLPAHLRHLLSAAAVCGCVLAAKYLLPSTADAMLVVAVSALAAIAGAAALVRCAPHLLRPELAIVLHLLRSGSPSVPR